MILIAENIQRLLKERGLKMTTVIQDTRMSPTTAQQLKVNGNITTKTINKLCKYFNVEPGDLLSYIDDDIYEKQVTEQKLARIRELEAEIEKLKGEV